MIKFEASSVNKSCTFVSENGQHPLPVFLPTQKAEAGDDIPSFFCTMQLTAYPLVASRTSSLKKTETAKHSEAGVRKIYIPFYLFKLKSLNSF